ncbi:MAG: hypothetical protein M0R74_02045, partial [Dehalococcoidia bacterium]|nr:hypothetical protein [Dehalococcoidia bacterium]
ISHVRVVQRAPEAIVPPGLPRIPGEGEVFVSPALAKLIEADPEILGNRYGDTIAGTISREGLSHAGELVAISGEAADGDNYRGVLYRELPTGFHESALTLFIRVVIIIGVVVMLFPIAMFIASAARLDAQESDARLAAFRLAGADPAQVRWIVAWGALFSALPGVLLGLALFFAARPVVAQVEVDGRAFLPGDFALNGLSLLALLAVPAVVTAASFVGLRDVEISPLGVGRSAARKEVRPIGFLFLLPGFALLWYSLDLAGEGGGGAFATVGLVVSVLLILIGVALTGTWIGQLAARLLAAKVRSGSSLLAFRRIVADPHASFRTVSGVTFAVFAGTLFLSLSAALEREVQTEPLSGLRANVLWASYPWDAAPVLEGLSEGAVAVPMNFLSATGEDGAWLTVQQADCDVLARIVRMDGGCGGRVAIRDGGMVQPGDTILIEVGGGTAGLNQPSAPPVRFTIPADAHVFAGPNMGSWTPDVLVPPGTFDWFDDISGGVLMVAPPEGVGPGDRAFEQIRTALIRSHPSGFTYAAGEFDASAVVGLATMRNLVYGGTFAAFALSGATAAMAVAGGILARRRAFALLRMSGCSLGALRRTVMAEATLPLALVSVVSAGIAVAVSALMISRIGEGSVLPPPEFILPLVAGLIAGLALPLMTLPLLGHVTATERTRFD